MQSPLPSQRSQHSVGGSSDSGGADLSPSSHTSQRSPPPQPQQHAHHQQHHHHQNGNAYPQKLPSHTEIHTSSPIAAGLPILEIVKNLEEEKIITRDDRALLKDALYSTDPHRREEMIKALCEVELSSHSRFAIRRLKTVIHQNGSGEVSSKSTHHHPTAATKPLSTSLRDEFKKAASMPQPTLHAAMNTAATGDGQHPSPLFQQHIAHNQSTHHGTSQGHAHPHLPHRSASDLSPLTTAAQYVPSGMALPHASAGYSSHGNANQEAEAGSHSGKAVRASFPSSSSQIRSSDHDPPPPASKATAAAAAAVAVGGVQQSQSQQNTPFVSHRPGHNHSNATDISGSSSNSSSSHMPATARAALLSLSPTHQHGGHPNATAAATAAAAAAAAAGGGAPPPMLSNPPPTKLRRKASDLSPSNGGGANGSHKRNANGNAAAAAAANDSDSDDDGDDQYNVQSTVSQVVGQAPMYSGQGDTYNVLMKIDQRLHDLVAKIDPVKLRTRKLAILVGSGSFNPLTRMHLRTYFLAKQYLESHLGYIVLGSLLSPAHPVTVRERYRTNPSEIIPAPHRLAMAQLLVQNSKWVSIDPWEITRRRAMDYLSLLEHVQSIVQNSLAHAPSEIKILYLCKANMVPKLSPQALKTGSFGCVSVCRTQESDQLRQSLSAKWNGLISVVEDNAILDASFDMVTSRKVRDKIKANETVETLVGAKIQEYCLLHKLGPKMNGTDDWTPAERQLPKIASRPAEPALRSQQQLLLLHSQASGASLHTQWSSTASQYSTATSHGGGGGGGGNIPNHAHPHPYILGGAAVGGVAGAVGYAPSWSVGGPAPPAGVGGGAGGGGAGGGGAGGGGGGMSALQKNGLAALQQPSAAGAGAGAGAGASSAAATPMPMPASHSHVNLVPINVIK